MSRVIEKTVYEFDELDDRGKDRARDWFRQGAESDPAWADSVLEDSARMADILGIDLATRAVPLMNGSVRRDPIIYYSGFCSQGDGACFEGTYRYKAGSVKAIAAEAPAGEDKTHASNNELNRIARELYTLQRPAFYRLSARVAHTGRYSHEYSTTIDVYRGDDDADTETTEALADLLHDFMRWIYRALEREYEYQQSDETVDENIRANEYTFDADGRRAD